MAGKTVLVQGGAGTVGLLAVQLAQWGARGIATCGAMGRERAHAAGSDVVLDYRAKDLAAQILQTNGASPVDLIVEVESGLNIETDAQVTAENGCIATYGSAQEMSPSLPFLPLLFKAVRLERVRIYLLTETERPAVIARLHGALNAGALSFEVQKVFDFSEACHAHEAVEAGARPGAVLIQTGNSQAKQV